MHVVLAIVGALIGASLASEHSWLFPVFIGASVGLGIAQAVHIAGRLKSLQADLDQLRAFITSEPDRPRDAASIQVRPEAAARGEPIIRAPAPSVVAPIATQTVSPPAPPPGAMASAASSRFELEQPAPEPPIVGVVWHFFTGGNALVRAGIVVLFFGVAFLLRYLAEHTHVPIEFRLSGVALGGLVLLVLGWRLRTHRPGYALALQGGAVGILYLTVFAAMRLYALLSPATAFPLLVVVAGLSATLAVLQSSLAFALLAITGGFLAPILASSWQGDHVVLFTYYSILNAAILGTAWFKAWRPLNLAGFLFTFVIATLWGVLHYRVEDFPTTEPFLILFFLFYVAIAVLFTLRQPPELRGYVDASLVFGMPIAAFGLQTAMLRDQLLPLAYSALAASGVYLSVAWLLHWCQKPTQRLLIEAFLALGVTFLSLAVPLALDGNWSAATWGLEGAALIWVGCRQKRPLARAFGALLQLAAGCTIWLKLEVWNGTFMLPEGMYLSGLLLGAASSYAACTLHSNLERLRQYEFFMLGALFFWGLICWSVSGLSELQRLAPHSILLNAELAFVAVTALLSSELCQRFKLSIARVPALLLLPMMIVFALATAAMAPHPLANGGWISWPLAFAVFYLAASRHEGSPDAALAHALHAVSAWVVAALMSWELSWQIRQMIGISDSWSGIAWAVIPALLLFLTPTLTTKVAWPFKRNREAYLLIAASGFAVYLGLWSIAANLLMRGGSYPLPYVPMLNPLDLALTFVLLVLMRHVVILRREGREAIGGNEAVMLGAVALLAFIALNGVLIRALNHWAGVPFTLESMLQSTLVQTSVSIYWALLALTTMLVATRRAIRVVWVAGVSLMAVVVLKLFVVDLSSVGTIERIVSFVGVGLLMLILGYFSPLPPAAEERR